MRRGILLLVAIAAGCASSEPPPGLEPSPGPRAERGAAPVGSTTRAGEAPPREPVRGLTLEQALRFADRFHPYMALARAEIEAHEGRLVQAGVFPSTAAIFRMESARMRGRTFGEAEYLAGVLGWSNYPAWTRTRNRRTKISCVTDYTTG